MNKRIRNYLTNIWIFKWLFLVSAFIFNFGLIVGYIFTDYSVTEIERISNDRPKEFYDYFFNNLMISYLNVIGMISFGLSSIYVLFINGVVLGGAIKVSMTQV